LIRYKDIPIHQPYVDQVSNAEGITVKAKSKWFNCVHVRGELTNIQALANFSFVNHSFC
jgi:serine protease AprX